MTKRSLLLGLAFLLLGATLCSAQVPANPSAFDFTSLDHNAVIPAGQENAGQSKLVSYQASLFNASADVSSGVPIAVGPVVAKNVAVAQPTANVYRLTRAQLGIVLPPCSTLPCPQYTIVLVAIGPNNITSTKGVASESSPFTAAVPSPQQPPAAPTSVIPIP